MNKHFIFKGCKRVFLLLLLIAPNGYGQEIAIIIGAKVNSQAISLNAREVQRIFLRKKYFTAEGSVWIPVNLSAANPVRTIINKHILQKSVADLERYWSEMYFDGISPPYVLASEESIMSFVMETPGAISYILGCHVDTRVQVVYRFQVANNPALSCSLK